METVIIESNRKSAYADETRAQRHQEAGQLNNVPSDSNPNYEWSTGLEVGVALNPGDEIKVGASMIHARGDPANTIEIGGAEAAERPEDLVDNVAAWNLGYYITNRHQFSFPMPQFRCQVRALWSSPLYGEIALDSYGQFQRAFPYHFVEGHYVNKALRPGPYRRTQQSPYFSYDGQPFPWDSDSDVTLPINLNPKWSEGDIAGQENLGQNQGYIEAPNIHVENWWVPISNGPYEICRPNTTRLQYMSASYEGPANLRPTTTVTQPQFSQRVTLSVDPGFTSPTAIADTLTSQFHNRQGQASAWDDSTITPKTFSFEPEGGRENKTGYDAFVCQPNIDVPLFPGTVAQEYDRPLVRGGNNTVQQQDQTVHTAEDFHGINKPPPSKAIIASNNTGFRGRPLPAVTDSAYRCVPTATGQICYGREKVLDDGKSIPNDYAGTRWSCDIRGEYDPNAGTLPMNWRYVQEPLPGTPARGAPNQCKVCQHPSNYKQSEGYGMLWNHMLCGNTKDAAVAEMWAALGRTAIPAAIYDEIKDYNETATASNQINVPTVISGWYNIFGTTPTPRFDGSFAQTPAYANPQWADAITKIPTLNPNQVSQYGYNVVIQDKLAHTTPPEVLGPIYVSSTTNIQPDTTQTNTAANGEGDHYSRKLTVDQFKCLNIKPGAWIATNILCNEASLRYCKAAFDKNEFPSSVDTIIPERGTTLSATLDAPFQYNDITTPVYQAPTPSQKQAMDANFRFRMQFGRSDDQYCCGSVGKHINLPCSSNVSLNGLAGGVPASATWNLAKSYFGSGAPGTLAMDANYKDTNPADTKYLSNTGNCRRMYYEADNEVRKGKQCIPSVDVLSRWSPLCDPRRPGNMFCKPSNAPNAVDYPQYTPAELASIPENQLSDFFQIQRPAAGNPAAGYDDELLDLIEKIGIAAVPVYMTEKAIAYYKTVTEGDLVDRLSRVPFIAFINMTDWYAQVNTHKKREIGIIACPGIGEFFGPSSSLNDLQYAKIVSTQKTDPSKAPPDRGLVVTTSGTGAEAPNADNGNTGVWEMNPATFGGSQAGLNTFSYPQCNRFNIFGDYEQGITTPGSRTGDYFFPPDVMCGATHRYAACVYLGADQPQIVFEGQEYGRFSLKYMHSACRTGNGPWQWITETVNDQFGTESAFVNSKQAMISCTGEKFKYGRYAVDGSTGTNAEPTSWDYLQGEKWQRISSTSWYDIEQRSPPPQVITSQSGITLLSMTVPSKEQVETRVQPSDDPTVNTWTVTDGWHPNLFVGTLFHRMGFSVEQLVPLYGQPNSSFNRSTVGSQLGFDGPSALAKYNSMVLPLTTNGYIFSDLNVGISQNVLEYPMENLGIARTTQAITNVESDILLAKDLPFKLSYPYLVVYSDIAPKVSYYGGPRGMTQSLPALAFIGRSYDAGDYFYSFSTDWSKVITKSFVLNHFSVSIRTPNGRPAQLDSNSSIIFEIRRRLQLPAPLPPPGEKSHDTEKHASKKDRR